MDDLQATQPGASPDSKDDKIAPVNQIQQLLKAKDDTSRFVGLALLKSTLDASEELRNDQSVMTLIWNSISSKFLDRLLRTGSKPSIRQGEAKEMLDLAAHVIYTFAVLLPVGANSDSKLLGRVPLLVDAILQSSQETTDIILKTLLTIVSSSADGSTTLATVEDLSPLIEIAPRQPMALSILAWAWTNGAHIDREASAIRLDCSIGGLCASFKGTDALTLLNFLSKLLGRLDADLLLLRPTWLDAAVDFIHKLVAMKPTAASREAFTNCAANLLIVFSDEASQKLFNGIFKSSKSLPYLFVHLVLIDVRSSLPTLLDKLNSHDYPAISERLTSALIILSFFITYLLDIMERAESEDSFADIQPELLLKLRDSVVETLSLLMEYLRDRWDAAISGAQGLHREARVGEAHTVFGSLKTLAWDSKHESASEDRLLLAALKALGDWLREDDGPTLRGVATGLVDILMDLYQPTSAARVGVATRPLVLGVLDGIVKEDDGVQSLLEHDGWAILSKDLTAILSASETSDTINNEVGQHISAILTVVAETRSNTPEDWLDVVTSLSAYSVPHIPSPSLSLQQLWADVLDLCTMLLSQAPLGVRRRYIHSASALSGIAATISKMELDLEVKLQISNALNQFISVTDI